MKKNILTFVSVAIVVIGSAQAQSKPKRDSLKFDTIEVQTIYRNSQIIQSNLHALHLDAILRDKLDSVYTVNAKIIEGKFIKPKATGKAKGK